MNLNLSTNTIIIAMQAVDAEIKRCEALAKASGLADAEVEENSRYILDLMRALSELDGAYEEARKEHPELAPAEEWLTSE
jgi:hypothetical protein